MVEEDVYTFIGVTADGQALFMDIAALTGSDAALRHGGDLFALHDSGPAIEIWCGMALVARLPRPILDMLSPT